MRITTLGFLGLLLTATSAAADDRVQIDQNTSAIRAEWLKDGANISCVHPVQAKATHEVLELDSMCETARVNPLALRRLGGKIQLTAINKDKSEIPLLVLPQLRPAPMPSALIVGSESGPELGVLVLALTALAFAGAFVTMRQRA